MLGESRMRKLGKLSLILIVYTLTLAMVCRIGAQAKEEDIKNFFSGDMPGGTIQVNATTKTQPMGNLTLWLRIVPQTGVYLGNLSYTLRVYGFQNGTDQEAIGNITDQNLNLPNGTIEEYNRNASFLVPSDVWGTTFGSITLTYSISFLGTPIPMNVTSGFYMTNVENTYLESLESQNNVLKESINQLTYSYNNLTALYSQALANITQLNQNVTQLNQNITLLTQNYTQLLVNYTALHNSMNDLDNTREVAVILAITTVFFVATTAFMIMRRPRERW